MGKFKYSMQNILDIKIKLETQAKNEFSEANRAYLTEKEKLEELFKKRAVYEAALKEQLSGSLNISEINICKKNINSLKSAIRTQLMNVKKAEDIRIYMGQKGADHFIADGEHVIPQGASYDDIITILTQK